MLAIMRTRIKICCIASIDEAQLAIAAGADALGLVAAVPCGPGVLPDARIAKIAAWAPPPVSTFLLTAETTASRIAEHVAATLPTTVQIVNHIAPQEVAELARLLPQVRRVQVIHVEGGDALAMIPAHAPHVHAFLLDTGRSHDWAISARFVRASPVPVFLAGGLDDSNVAGALRQVRPYGIDLCSRVRTDGRLDILKLALLTSAVREADALLYAEG
ncbi:phosphoribosylanthranilate isomerase [Janthinobacterium psychrotolerans]|uniref:N-(5'-phosphoribosyl)anthranilate isomerase n=2 Tax=Janthinobacterium psychrotolerans TaxID=1747903 RepID=A0A1A7C0S2_9BURK|nr:phosphoribosylanthranilate isomerase [Janthinobacterium psychrotolerans]